MTKVRDGLKITDLRRLIRSNSERDESGTEARKIKVYATRTLIGVAIILTLMNVVKHYTVMAIATTVLTLCLAVCSFLFDHQKVRIGNTIMMVIIGVLFTYFAVCGQNDGFAILWIMLIPGLSTSIMNIRKGLEISIYFQLLILAMFYTPWREQMIAYYTPTFIMRFPVLYLANLFVSFLILFEKEYYSEKVNNMAITDNLTGLLNRRGYEEKFRKLEKNWDDIKTLTVMSIDVNGLKRVNDTIGHMAGDETIVGAADCIRVAFPDAVAVARVGGDEYSVISDRPYAIVDKQIAKLHKNVDEWRGVLVDKISISLGQSRKVDYPELDFMELYNISDENMYEVKRKYYEEHKDQKR